MSSIDIVQPDKPPLDHSEEITASAPLGHLVDQVSRATGCCLILIAGRPGAGKTYSFEQLSSQGQQRLVRTIVGATPEGEALLAALRNPGAHYGTLPVAFNPTWEGLIPAWVFVKARSHPDATVPKYAAGQLDLRKVFCFEDGIVRHEPTLRQDAAETLDAVLGSYRAVHVIIIRNSLWRTEYQLSRRRSGFLRSTWTLTRYFLSLVQEILAPSKAGRPPSYWQRRQHDERLHESFVAQIMRFPQIRTIQTFSARDFVRRFSS